ncbi:MAG: hypothetical protein LUO89_02335 [Methanothrix sp.]|nr:hypothetical protein [Methanothrix sp.]
MKAWVITLAVALLLISITGISAAATKCHMNSTQNLSLSGFMFYSDFDIFSQILEEEDFTAATEFLNEKHINGYATIFENDEAVYVDDSNRWTDPDHPLKVRRPGETDYWVTSPEVVVCPD